MAQLLDALRTHIDYATWASAKLLAAAEALTSEELARDFGTADNSVIGTVAHIFAADRIWLRRLQGAPPPTPFLDKDREIRLDTLQTEWPPVLGAWKELAAGWTEESLAQEIAYKQMNGQPFVTPVWQIVLHLVNHASHHRGQAVGFIRSMGHQPPRLDLIFYYRELDAARASLQ
jgi:uncharacterized damage-inducible protein DinB